MRKDVEKCLRNAHILKVQSPNREPNHLAASTPYMAPEAKSRIDAQQSGHALMRALDGRLTK